MHHDESQSNKKSTPTSDIAPGAPIWYRSSSGVHNNRDVGHGYSAQDPVPLTSGRYNTGGALTRFGKFGFKKDETRVFLEHGIQYDIKIIREEGAQGQWTLRIGQDPNDTGVLGRVHSGVEHGYSVCRVDLDLITLNENLPGFDWDEEKNEALITFKEGETEKTIKALAPYRTTVKTLEPDVLRQPFTYHVPEYIPYNFGAHRQNGQYQVHRSWGRRLNATGDCDCWSNGNGTEYNPPHGYGADYNNYSIRHGKQTTEDRWAYYHVYTLPMPRTWIEKLRGNEVYLDNYDRNYSYRQLNNTCRPKHMPNRFDDTTESDAATDGWVTRYDHNNKMEVVVGRSRFVSMYWQHGNRHTKNHSGYVCHCRRSRYNTMRTWRTEYKPDREYHFLSNDRRITHRTWPEYYGLTTVGITYRPILNSAGEEQYIPRATDQTAQIYTGTYCWQGRWGQNLPQIKSYISLSGTYGYSQLDLEYDLYTVNYPGRNIDFWKTRRYNTYWGQWNSHFVLADDNYCINKLRNQCGHGCFDHNGRMSGPGPGYALNAEWAFKPNARTMWNMQTGWGIQDDTKHWNSNWFLATNLKNSADDLKPFDKHPNSNPSQGRQDLKYVQIPLNNMGWKREDYTGDPWFKLFNDLHGTYYPKDPRKSIAKDGSNRNIEFYSYILNSRGSTLGMQFLKGLHPITPIDFHNWNPNITWPDGIPAKWQSFYESTRYKPGLEDPDTKHWNAERSETSEPALTKTKIQGLTSQPKDKIFNYGDPANGGVGDLAQVMFNHYGVKRDKFITGQSSGATKLSQGNRRGGHAEVTAETATKQKTEWFVVRDEDPSRLKELYDGYSKNWWVWPEHRHYNLFGPHMCYNGHCYWTRTFTDVNKWEDGVRLNGFTAPEDWTDHWLVHEPLCAGKLEPLDVSNDANNFSGYKWDRTTYDTSKGIESREVGYGSPGHGEDGESRFLYDFRDMVHPLSSYELNEVNLKGYYMCCTDHINRSVRLTISHYDEDDPYALGETVCIVKLLHLPEYNPERHETYDPKIKGDSRIEVGPTFKTNDDWDKPPTNLSVTERLFTVDGALPTDPVVFLGLSAGVFPGGDPENPYDQLPPAPGILRIEPLGSRQFFDIERAEERDWENDPLTSIKTYKNTGDGELIITFPYSLGEADPYTKADGTTSGDDASLWSWEYIDAKKPEEVYVWPDRPENLRTGPEGLFNTVTLSAHEQCTIKYTLKGQSKRWAVYTSDEGGNDPAECMSNYSTSKGYTYTNIEYDVIEIIGQELSPETGEMVDISEVVGKTTTPRLDIPTDPALAKTVKTTTATLDDESVVQVVSHIQCPSRYNSCNHDIVVKNTDGSETLRSQSFYVKYLGKDHI